MNLKSSFTGTVTLCAGAETTWFIYVMEALPSTSSTSAVSASSFALSSCCVPAGCAGSEALGAACCCDVVDAGCSLAAGAAELTAELAAASAALSAALVAAADEAPSTCTAASSAAAPSPAYTCDGETAGQPNPIKTTDSATDSAL